MGDDDLLTVSISCTLIQHTIPDALHTIYVKTISTYPDVPYCVDCTKHTILPMQRGGLSAHKPSRNVATNYLHNPKFLAIILE